MIFRRLLPLALLILGSSLLHAQPGRPTCLHNFFILAVQPRDITSGAVFILAIQPRDITSGAVISGLRVTLLTEAGRPYSLVDDTAPDRRLPNGVFVDGQVENSAGGPVISLGRAMMSDAPPCYTTFVDSNGRNAIYGVMIEDTCAARPGGLYDRAIFTLADSSFLNPCICPFASQVYTSTVYYPVRLRLARRDRACVPVAPLMWSDAVSDEDGQGTGVVQHVPVQEPSVQRDGVEQQSGRIH